MLPKAYIVHQLRSRVRFRIREKRQDTEYFEAVTQRIESLQGVEEIKANPNTGSLLLLHPDQPFDELVGELAELELFEIIDAPGPKQSALMPVFGGISEIDRGMAEETAGNFDLRTLAIIGLVGVSVYQIYRGHVMAPAIPMLLSALDLAQQIKADSAEKALPESEP
jgi:hypothetical protein